MSGEAIVQIGLHERCEYLYLLSPKYQQWDIPIELPIFEASKAWCYYGVDMNPHWIHNYRQEPLYHLDPRVHFIHALVHAEDNKDLRHDNFTVKENGNLQMKSTALETLFSEISEPIGVLAMDVEGAELDIIKGYSWSECPKYIIIEIHNIEDIHPITEILTAQRYRFTMINQKQTDIQCGYIHKDYFRQFKDDFVAAGVWRYNLYNPIVNVEQGDT